MLRVLLYVSICLRFGDGFLLETNTQKADNLTGSNKQCVTLNEFYEAKKEQQYDLNVLSHKMERMKSDSEKTLTLLTSQIQQKLLSMENSFKVNGQKNETDELQQLHQINRELQNRFTKLQKNFDNLQTKYKVIENELLQSRNTTSKLSVEVQTLQQLKTVQQLQDLNGLKLEMQSISKQTHSLAVNQQARNQDFLALYNQTTENQIQQECFYKPNNGVPSKYKGNDKKLAQTYISNNAHYDTGTATAVVELQLGDKVWVRYDNGRVDSSGTCMTIVKLM
ncbi:Hypothetical predicted protein [Mytilus galloprovincialis]|uniref:C1q domain-containing protein n=1 Tax=Mytilus galloprovincialis TaxID=29158 RepID=A0A8B6EB38_MYTGA|nr:Hypothetical predicted protein [Mytilus galloprovincialis]